MVPSQVAVLLLRLLGVYCLIRSVETLSQGIAVPMPSGQSLGAGWAVAAIIAPAVWLLVCGAVLLRFAKPLGNRLAMDVAPVQGIASQSFERWLAMAFTVAGVTLVAWETPQPILQALVNLWAWRHASDSVTRERAF